MIASNIFLFLSTPPSRVATVIAYFLAPHVMFLSTPPSRVATMLRGELLRMAAGVSIHATLAGGDEWPEKLCTNGVLFLSTPPSRVATCLSLWMLSVVCCFYPRHPRGWRPILRCSLIHLYLFLSTPPSRVATTSFFIDYYLLSVSIHATLAGGDTHSTYPRNRRFPFLSTPPSRVATVGLAGTTSAPYSFYPRHPRGWRPSMCRRGASR